MNNYKILLLADGGAGKSVFLTRILENRFEKKYVATLGVDLQVIRKDENIYTVWDCAGQEKFSGLGDKYYVGAQGAIFGVDLTSKLSLRNLKNWVSSCHKVTGNIPCVIVGFKSDIATISDEEVRKYTGTIPYVRVSSKENTNVEEPFNILKGLLP